MGGFFVQDSPLITPRIPVGAGLPAKTIGQSPQKQPEKRYRSLTYTPGVVGAAAGFDLLPLPSTSNGNSIPNRPAISLRPNAVSASARLSRSCITHLRLSAVCSNAAPSDPPR